MTATILKWLNMCQLTAKSKPQNIAKIIGGYICIAELLLGTWPRFTLVKKSLVKRSIGGKKEEEKTTHKKHRQIEE